MRSILRTFVVRGGFPSASTLAPTSICEPLSRQWSSAAASSSSRVQQQPAQQDRTAGLGGQLREHAVAGSRPDAAGWHFPRRLFHATASSLASDFYSTLGVSRGAAEGEIKKAYYKLAKQYHPDTNQDDPEAAKKFQEVQRAYDTLRDPQKRAAYDQLGHAAYESAESTGGAPGGGDGPFGPGVDAEELLRSFFGGGRGGGRGGAGGFEGTIFEHMFTGGGGQWSGSRRPMRQVLRAGMTISFDEAMKGAKKVLNLASFGIRDPGAKPVEVSIPPGVDSGFQLRLDGVLQGGPNSPSADLLLQIMVAPSNTFRRDEFDLYIDVPVNMVDAALGTTVEVPTIDGRAEVKIKPGTQPSDRLRMRGYGVRMDAFGHRGRRGDQYVVVHVTVPRTLTAHQRQLLEEFKEGKPRKKQEDKTEDSSSSKGTSDSKEEPKEKKRWWDLS